MNSLFLQSVQHLQPLYYQQIADSKTYIFLKSYFKNAWCSFLVPKVDSEKLDWDKVESIVEKEKKKGYIVSFYVHESLNKKYKTSLERRGYKLLGNDAYLYKSLTGVRLATAKYQLVEVDKDNIEEYIKLSVKCFPDWNNNQEYCQHIYDLSERNDEVMMEQNYLIERQGIMVGVGAMLLNKRMNLLYLHNMATLPKYRRQGVFSWLVGTMETVALGAGVDQVYSIAEEDSASYKGLDKLGYSEVERYYVYAKES